MTKEATAMPQASRPYARSWLNQLIDGIERLPGPPWLFFVVLALVSIPISNSQDWLSGKPLGALSVTQTYYAFLLAGMLWLIHYLDRVARDVLAIFRPALAISDEDADDLRYRLTTIPARGAAILAVVAVLWTLEAFIFQPETEGIVGLSPLALSLRFPLETATTAIILVMLYHTVRQMRLVGRIHALAPAIDLYQPAPLYAFSNLTARTGIGLLLLLTPSFFFIPAGATGLDYAVFVGWFTILIGIAGAAFVLPLQGIHGRIAEEKRRLEAGVGQRLTITSQALHRSIDVGDYSQADGLNKTLASLIAERDLVHKLSTWPWRPGTVGTMASALALPIVLWLVTRFLGNYV